MVKVIIRSAGWIICLLFVSSSCKKGTPFIDDKLSLEKRDYTGIELKVNGYYINQHGTIFIFYRNGVLLHGGDAFDPNDRRKNDEILQSQEFIENLRDVKYS